MFFVPGVFLRAGEHVLFFCDIFRKMQYTFRHRSRVLHDSTCHLVLGDQLPSRNAGVNAEYRDLYAVIRTEVVAVCLQSTDGALSHCVTVADDELDHVTHFLVVLCKVGKHIVLHGGEGPFSGQIQLVVIHRVLIEIIQFGVTGFRQV